MDTIIDLLPAPEQRPPVCHKRVLQYRVISAKEPNILGFYPQKEPYVIHLAPSPRTTPPGMSQKSPTIQGSFRKRALYCGSTHKKRNTEWTLLTAPEQRPQVCCKRVPRYKALSAKEPYSQGLFPQKRPIYYGFSLQFNERALEIELFAGRALFCNTMCGKSPILKSSFVKEPCIGGHFCGKSPVM